MQRRLFLTFPRQLVQEPVVHDLLRKFPVKANIRGASVTDEIALLALHMEGDEKDLSAAVEWLKGLGVVIEDLTE